MAPREADVEKEADDVPKTRGDLNKAKAAHNAEWAGVKDELKEIAAKAKRMQAKVVEYELDVLDHCDPDAFLRRCAEAENTFAEKHKTAMKATLETWHKEKESLMSTCKDIYDIIDEGNNIVEAAESGIRKFEKEKKRGKNNTAYQELKFVKNFKGNSTPHGRAKLASIALFLLEKFENGEGGESERLTKSTSELVTDWTSPIMFTEEASPLKRFRRDLATAVAASHASIVAKLNKKEHAGNRGFMDPLKLTEDNVAAITEDIDEKGGRRSRRSHRVTISRSSGATPSWAGSTQ